MRSIATYARIVTLSLIATLFVAFAPGTASACSCLPVNTPEMVEQAHTVFVGEEIARSEHRGDDGWASVAVTFQVAEAYKGRVADQMTVVTGMGGGDCGVSQTSGLVGITIQNAGEPSIDICGSVHEAGAIAAVIDPIDILVSAPEPPTTAEPGGFGMGGIVLAAGIGMVLAGIGVAMVRRRRDEWQDGWSSSG